jgi:hypothetical protein
VIKITKSNEIELVCPYCGFNHFAVLDIDGEIVYRCLTCDKFSENDGFKLVNYKSFDDFTRKNYMVNPEELVNLRELCLEQKRHEHFGKINGYNTEDIYQISSRLLGIPEELTYMVINYDKSEVEISKNYLNAPLKISMDYRDIIKVYNLIVTYGHDNLIFTKTPRFKGFNSTTVLYMIKKVIPDHSKLILYKPIKRD